MTLKSALVSSRIFLMAIALAVACAATAVARQEPGADETQFEPQLTTTWFTMPVRAGIFTGFLIVAWAFGFYAFFPWILDRKSAIRPLRAYGLAAGLIWVAWCGSAFLVFHDMLVLESSNFEGTVGGFLRDWLLTCLICLSALVGFAMLRMIFGARSARADS